MLEKKRFRGPNKGAPWKRAAEDGLSVLRLPLDTMDPLSRRRLERVFSSAFSLRRALQSDVRHSLKALRAASKERGRTGPQAVRQRLGLTREALEHRAYRHLDRAPHLRQFVTKALAMHLADSVWTAAERHLFPDASGKRFGIPRIGWWFDFEHLPGRARSHTRERKWETFRLHGTLAGHRAAYTGAGGRFFQPRRMRAVPSPDSWWTHAGALAVVFSGIAGGELVLPVRLPAEPSNQPILDHHLGDPSRWHKIDLVRRRDPNAKGGWRYEAHLMVLVDPYASKSTSARREIAARQTRRRAGIDVNVSNITVASHAGGSELRITRVERDAGQREAARVRARDDRRRLRALERSRRAANPEQYELSARQKERAQRREAAGLAAKGVIPRGPRKSSSNGRPLRAFRKDRLTRCYRQGRAAIAAAAASASQARRDSARRIAGRLVLEHGFRAAIEEGSLAGWARQWGRALHAFSPGTLLAELRRETTAVARVAKVPGAIVRASTGSTALSQHCLCGERARKRLSDRVHRCPACGLAGDRDAVSATLASFIEWRDLESPGTAYVDFDATRRALPEARGLLQTTMNWAAKGRQDAPSESTAHPAPDGFFVGEPERTSLRVTARRISGTAPRATPDEIGSNRPTTPERSRMRTGLSSIGVLLAPIRDSS